MPEQRVRSPLTALTRVLEALTDPLRILAQTRNRVAGGEGEGTETREQKEDCRHIILRMFL